MLKPFYRPYILLVFLYFISQPIFSQHHQETGNPEKEQLESLADFFTKGRLSGHVRTFFMTTINQRELTNYYAQAIGGVMHYDSPEFHGFHFGAAGIFTYKAFSSDLNAPDPTTGRISKWEHELFDVLDFNNFKDLDRLEELYIQYRFKRGSITYGKLEIEDTPLLNRSDGRMKPFVFKGSWLDLQLGSYSYLQAAWLDRISPRSTVEWFDFNEGIGLANNGFQPDGSEADYYEHQQSRGVALLGYHRVIKKVRLELYQWYLHNISYTGWVGLEYLQNGLGLGLQYALQFPDGFQGRLPYEQRFVQPEENGQVISGMVRWMPNALGFRASYTHAFDSGRFLFPRELGRDHFFTSLSRSRLDGFGNADVLTLAGMYATKIEGLTADLEWTSIWGPRPEALTFNKYGLDAYWQTNVCLRYEFQGFLKGLRMELLYVYKQNKNSSDPEVVFNRSNFHQLNFITNFVF